MTENIKSEAHELIEQLPNVFTWEDLAYKIEIRALIERGATQPQAGELLAQD